MKLSNERQKIKDIEKLFGLTQNVRYSASDIELKQTLLREKLLSSGNIDKMRTRELITFLDDAKKWLVYEFCKFILKDIQNGDITDFERNGVYEITGEYLE